MGLRAVVPPEPTAQRLGPGSPAGAAGQMQPRAEVHRASGRLVAHKAHGGGGLLEPGHAGAGDGLVLEEDVAEKAYRLIEERNGQGK